jgi:hypothetical protein
MKSQSWQTRNAAMPPVFCGSDRRNTKLPLETATFSRSNAGSGSSNAEPRAIPSRSRST